MKAQMTNSGCFAEGSASGSASGWLAAPQPDLSRKRPKATKLDLEKMFQDSIELDHIYQQLVHENELIKLELGKVDALRSSRQNLISSVESVITEKSKELHPEAKSSSWLVFKLKKHLHTFKRQIECREKHIADFDKNTFHQILKEKEVHITLNQNERECLQRLIDQFNVPANQVNCGQKNELYRMRVIARLQQDRLEELQVHQKVTQNELQVEQRSVSKLTHKIAMQEEQARKILEEQEELRQLQELAHQRRQCEKRELSALNDASHPALDIKPVEQSIMELQSIKDFKNQRIRELESTIEKIIEREYQEKQRLEVQLQSLTKMLAPALDGTDTAKNVAGESLKLVEPTSKSEKESPSILMARVKPTQIAPIGRYLRFNLMTKKYTHECWKRELFSNDDTQASIKVLTEKLQMQPFEVKDPDEAKLLARYLVEDDTEKIYYNEKASQVVSIIKAILEKVIGPIKIYSEAEEQQVLNESSTILTRYRALVIPALHAKAEKRTTLTEKQLIEVIDGCMLDLTSEHLEYLVLFLFSFSKSLRQLCIADMDKLGAAALNYQNN